MKVSVIIVNLNTSDLLRDCLQSVFSEAMSLDLEVILVDNGSTDGSVEMVKRNFSGVRLIQNATNEGFAKPNNDGMRAGVGEYLFLLNSDTVVCPGALKGLVAFLDQHHDAGACGPMLVHPDGTLQRSVMGFPTLWTHFCDMFFLDRLFPKSRVFGSGEASYFSYNQTSEIDHLMAAAFLVRRQVLTDAGMFDERFVIYYNDMDWCYRIVESGWRIYFVHTVKIIHHGGRTVSMLNKDFAYFLEMHNNKMLYYKKHVGDGAIAMYKVILAVGFFPRAIGWTMYCFFKPSPHAAMMRRFSWMTLRLGLRFWEPLEGK